jgi:hypothetical protein
MFGLASIHSRREQIDAATACRMVASIDSEVQLGIAEGCWIGLTDSPVLAHAMRGTFVWLDGSPVRPATRCRSAVPARNVLRR